MKIIVVVVVFDRYENIAHWLNCWKYSEVGELIVIHNYDGSEKIKELCDKAGVKYIRRENKGFDIGAFQDVVKERLEGFDNNWDRMLWCCDDIFPMTKDFVTSYLRGGLVCTDLSPYVKTHIRTTGFMIDKATSLKLTFDVDPVLTKKDCYNFEHQSRNAFYEQMIRMGVKVSQVSSRETAPLWDSGYKRRLPRENEKYGLLADKIAFICPVYNSYPQIISSLITQTHANWELLLIHDGPNSTGIKQLITDARIKYIETAERRGKWGHYIRQWALENIDKLSPNCDYVVITNADNYHVSVYCEYLLRGLQNNPNAVAAYCSEMVHSYKAWQVIQCSLRLGFIDCAGVMVRKEIAKQVGWRDTESHSSDWTYFNDIIQKYGSKWTKVPGCLLIHN
jgi:hypothetical protein